MYGGATPGNNDNQEDSISVAYSKSTRDHENSIPSRSINFYPPYRKYNNKEIIVRLFEKRSYWNKYGNLTVCCNNACVVAPVKLWWWMAEIFVIVTVGVFAYEFFSANWIILVPAVIVGILEWMAFYKTCMRDPGVQPRPDFVDAVKNLIAVLASYNGELGTLRLVGHPNGQQEKQQFCWRCYHFKALSTSHCSQCDTCMIVHDHHCPVFGGCVAKNNISSFHTMIVTMALFWVYMVGYSIYHMISQSESFEKSVSPTDGTTITFYVILAEVFAVLTIPMIVSCTKEMCCRSYWGSQQPSKPTKQKDVAYTILKFARENNFTLQERIQLSEILEIQDSVAEEIGIEVETQDSLNHNNYYPETQSSS